jgi:hypothetical protein
MEINEVVARKLLQTVDMGLSSGLGQPVPGEMCVEAAVCYALGLPHGDNPKCVDSVLRTFKIRLNDAPWSSNSSRAKGMRRLALIQLGSVGKLDQVFFVKQLSRLAAAKSAEYAEYAAKYAAKSAEYTEYAAKSAEYAAEYAEYAAEYAAKSAEYAEYAAKSAESAAKYAAESAAAYAESAAEYAESAAEYAESAAEDEVLSKFAEDVVQILISMKVPGCQWLYLTEQT